MTFSIIARDPERGHFGVAVSTAVPCVGAMVPHAKAGVGAIATQSFTNVMLGIDGLRLLEIGLSPEAALPSLLAEDPEAERRPVAGIDAQGRTVAASCHACRDRYGPGSADHHSVWGHMRDGTAAIRARAEQS